MTGSLGTYRDTRSGKKALSVPLQQKKGIVYTNVYGQEFEPQGGRSIVKANLPHNGEDTNKDTNQKGLSFQTPTRRGSPRTFPPKPRLLLTDDVLARELRWLYAPFLPHVDLI